MLPFDNFSKLSIIYSLFQSVDDDKEICFPQPDDLNLVHYVIKPIPQFDAEVMDMPLGEPISHK